MDARTILGNVQAQAAEFAAARGERQRRRTLAATDFERLRDAGFLRPPWGLAFDRLLATSWGEVS
jgi:hypothetical protein